MVRVSPGARGESGGVGESRAVGIFIGFMVTFGPLMVSLLP